MRVRWLVAVVHAVGDRGEGWVCGIVFVDSSCQVPEGVQVNGIPHQSKCSSYAHEEEKQQTNEVRDGVGEMAGGSCACSRGPRRG